MTEKDLEYVKIESTGFRDLCNQIKELQEENKQLILENERLNRMKTGLRLNNGKLTAERNKLQDQLIAANYELSQIKKMGMFEFADKYCNNTELEDAGRAFARELLGKPMTEEDFITAGETEYERTWDIADGDDF